MKHKRLHPVLSLLLLTAVFSLIAAPGPGGRTYTTASNPVLELEGAVAGYLYSAEGGYPYGEVLPEAIGPDRIQRKRLGLIRYEDLTLTIGANMSGDLQAWIKETLAGNGTRKSGAVIQTDYQGQIGNRLDFYNALITEIRFSTLDAISKSQGKITLKLSCDYCRESQPGGSISRAAGDRQKAWTQNNFRLKIDGLDNALSRVIRIENLAVKQNVSADMTGNPRFPMETTSIDASHFSVILPEEDAGALKQWMGNVAEKNGSIDIFSAGNPNILFTLSLSNIGLIRVAPETGIKGNEGSKNIKADMYLEKLDIHFAAEGDNSGPVNPSRRSG